MTVRDCLHHFTERLEAAGLKGSRVEVEWLLEYLLETPRFRLLLDPEREVPPAVMDRLDGLIARRIRRVPLQYLIGSVNFCGLELEVGPEVLVPRPETEQLAELAWRFLGSRAPRPAALDWGTGSGCVAIALAVHNPQAVCLALDISGAALKIARRNARRHRVLNRIEFLQSRGFSALRPARRFDLIVSNPPYIPTGQIGDLPLEVREYEPPAALDGGADGLECFRVLEQQARSRLKPSGRLMAEFGEGQEAELLRLFGPPAWRACTTQRDYSGTPRFLVAESGDS